MIEKYWAFMDNADAHGVCYHILALIILFIVMVFAVWGTIKAEEYDDEDDEDISPDDY